MKAVTPGGKQIELIVDSKSALYRFQFKTGGELPPELSGLFTEEKYARHALNRYLDTRATTKSRKAV